MDKSGGFISQEDLRAAVNAGVMGEAQATRLATIAQDRRGLRDALTRDDEPFEFFSGFAEIFVTVGLCILLAGVIALAALISSMTGLITLPLSTAGIAWFMALYFTLRRRMVLPSILLSLVYGFGILFGTAMLLNNLALSFQGSIMIGAVIGMFAMAVWYRVFHLPFAMFVFGLCGLVLIHSIFATGSAETYLQNLDQLFDLTINPGFALATLVFGMLAFIGGMGFDMRDRYRLGRYSATGFWLHLLAAPAMVNTVVYTLLNIGGNTGILLTALAMIIVTLLALVIDRRSFLTAGIVYIALVMFWLTSGEGSVSGSITTSLLLLGALITALGTFWTEMRARLMRALPDFPGKHKLPPYQEIS